MVETHTRKNIHTIHLKKENETFPSPPSQTKILADFMLFKLLVRNKEQPNFKWKNNGRNRLLSTPTYTPFDPDCLENFVVHCMQPPREEAGVTMQIAAG